MEQRPAAIDDGRARGSSMGLEMDIDIETEVMKCSPSGSRLIGVMR